MVEEVDGVWLIDSNGIEFELELLISSFLSFDHNLQSSGSKIQIDKVLKSNFDFVAVFLLLPRPTTSNEMQAH